MALIFFCTERKAFIFRTRNINNQFRMAHAVEGISIEFLSLGIKQFLKIEGFQRLQNDVII